MRGVTRMDAAIYYKYMSHTWMVHATYIDASGHTYMCDVTHNRHTHECTWMHDVKHTNASCHAYQCVMSHTWSPESTTAMVWESKLTLRLILGIYVQEWILWIPFAHKWISLFHMKMAHEWISQFSYFFWPGFKKSRWWKSHANCRTMWQRL